MAMVGVAFWQPTGGLTARVVWPGLRSAAAWRRAIFITWTGWTLAVALSYDDSTINIVVGIIIIIITAVWHKYLNDELKILCLLQFFPEVARNSLRIPWVFHVQRNPWVFQVLQVCGHPVLLWQVTATRFWAEKKSQTSSAIWERTHRDISRRKDQWWAKVN